MLARLAFGNIRRTLRDYAIYAITLVLGVAVFYAFNTIAVQADFLQDSASDLLTAAHDYLQGITVALALVMGFLMVYANSYLLRRRTKELGLYQVLGMRVGQVNAILIMETLAVGVLSLAVGIALGMLLSQLMVFATAALFRTNVSHFHFFVSTDALALTSACFVLMFLVMMLLNTGLLRRVQLADLMAGTRRSERNHVRNLPVSILLFVVGVTLVGAAYARLTRMGIPGFGSSFGSNRADFMLTTLMVTLGTVVLFFGLAGTVTGILTHTRGYWRNLRPFTVRQLAARVNTTCLSMAVIAMVLFLAITSVTTGMVVVQAVNQQMADETTFDASVIGIGFPQDSTQSPNLAQGMRAAGVNPDELGTHAQIDLRLPITVIGDADSRSTTLSDVQEAGGFTLTDIARAVGEELTGDTADYADSMVPHVLSLSDYNAVLALRGMDPVRLDANRYLMLRGSNERANQVLGKALRQGYSFDVAGTTLSPASEDVIARGSVLADGGALGSLCTLVVPDDVAARCVVYEPILNIQYKAGVDAQDADAQLGDDLDHNLTEQLDFSVLIFTANGIVQSSVGTRALVTYLAIYIGFVLVVACAAILAIQQLSSASDAVASYRVLGELGCPDRLVFGSLRTQVIVAFVLPLVVGLAHSVCALRVITSSLEEYGLTNLLASSSLTVAIFVLVYGGYLAFTYHTARGIVRGGLRAARHAL